MKQRTITVRLSKPIAVDNRLVVELELQPGGLPLPLAAPATIDAMTVRGVLAARAGLPPYAIDLLAPFDLALLLMITAASPVAQPDAAPEEAPGLFARRRRRA